MSFTKITNEEVVVEELAYQKEPATELESQNEEDMISEE